jgi:hypothetical protein
LGARRKSNGNGKMRHAETLPRMVGREHKEE